MTAAPGFGSAPESIEEYIVRAAWHMFNDEFSLAIEDYKWVAENSPAVEIHVPYLTGLAYLASGDVDSAAMYFQEEIDALRKFEQDAVADDWYQEDDKVFVENSAYRMASHQHRAAIMASKSKPEQRDEGVRDARQVDAVALGRPHYYVRTAAVHMRHDTLPLGHVVLEQAMGGKGSRNALLVAWEAKLFVAAGDDRKAISKVRQAISMDGHCVVALMERARIMASQDKFDAALKDVQAAIEALPGSPEPQICRGDVLFLQGQYDAAVTAYREASELEETVRTEPVQLHRISSNLGEHRFIFPRHLRCLVLLYDRLLEYLTHEQGSHVDERARVMMYRASALRALGDFSAFSAQLTQLHRTAPAFLASFTSTHRTAPVDMVLAREHIWIQLPYLEYLIVHGVGDVAPPPQAAGNIVATRSESLGCVTLSNLRAYYDLLLERYEAAAKTRAIAAWHMARAHIRNLQEDFEGALADYKAVGALSKGHWGASAGAGHIQLALLDLPEAIRCYTDALANIGQEKNEPAIHSQLLAHRGWAKRLACDFQAAREDLASAQARDSTNRLATYQIAQVELWSGHVADALEHLRKLDALPVEVASSRLHGTSLDADKRRKRVFELAGGKQLDQVFERAVVNMLVGDMTACVQDLRAIANTDLSFRAPSTRSLAYQFQGEPFASEPVDDAMLSSKLVERGVYFRDELFAGAEAIGCFGKAAELSPLNRVAFLNRALLFKDFANHARAVVDLSKCIDIVPSYSVHYHYRGLLYMELGMYPEARDDFTKLLELVPGQASVYRSRSAVWMQMYKINEAIEDLEQVVMLEKEADEAAAARGTARPVTAGVESRALALEMRVAREQYGAESETVRALKAAGERQAVIDRLSARIQLADAYMTMQKNTQAMLQYDEILAVIPDLVPVRFNRARALQASGQLSRAFDDYSECVRLEPANWSARYARAVVLQAMGRPNDALADYVIVARHDQEHRGLHNNMGVVYQDLGNIDKAIQCYTSAIHLNARDVQAFYNRAHCLRVLNQYEEAMADISVVLRERPNHYDALFERAIIRNARLELDEAMEDLELVIKHQPDNLEAILLVGIVQQIWGNNGEALSYYNAVLQRQNNNATALAYRGLIKALNGKLDSSMDDLNRALSIDSGLGIAYHHRGLVYRMLGDDDKALDDFRISLKTVKQTSGDVHNDVGLLCMNRNDYETALEHFYEAVTLSPDNADMINNRGLCLLQFGSVEAAMEDFKLAIELEEDFLDARNNLGIVYERLGNDALALKEFWIVCELSPFHVEALFNAGNVHKKLGQFAEAIPLYNRCERAVARMRKDGGAVDERQNAELFNNRGACKHATEDLDGAYADYSAALGLDATYIDALVNRGQLHLGRFEFQQAFDDLFQAQKHSPEPDDVIDDLLRLARLWLRIFSSACQDFRTAVAHSPFTAHVNLDSAAEPVGLFDTTPLAPTDFEQSIAPVNEALAERQNDVEALRQRIELCLRAAPSDEQTAERLEIGLRDATSASYACPHSQVELRFRLFLLQAKTAELLERWDMAVAAAEFACSLAVEPTRRADGYLYLAFLHQTVDALDKAFADTEQALVHAPDSLPAWIAKGVVGMARGHHKTAMEDFLQVAHRLVAREDESTARGQCQRHVVDVLLQYRDLVRRGLTVDAELYFEMQGTLARALANYEMAVREENKPATEHDEWK